MVWTLWQFWSGWRFQDDWVFIFKQWLGSTVVLIISVQLFYKTKYLWISENSCFHTSACCVAQRALHCICTAEIGQRSRKNDWDCFPRALTKAKQSLYCMWKGLNSPSESHTPWCKGLKTEVRVEELSQVAICVTPTLLKIPDLDLFTSLLTSPTNLFWNCSANHQLAVWVIQSLCDVKKRTLDSNDQCR